ncbi:NERD domain-containing protein [Janibacter cremeus]|uniref:nuclease-related domain-containing DEAD/DEAH box helicase n=1 Tax=Janibacter cremeus TaxID=1285192 RepID=UPI0023F683FD|nr:NERD domain-containing protein [Janibacter cremeus]WEV78617.1 NERD domain-containing protein [Janibacter cremeus]
MAPQLIPEDPRFTTESEQVVWERLRDSLRPEDTVIANLRLTDSRKDHEADLVVVMPDAGVIVVEVKGGKVRIEDGEWSTMRHGKRVPIHPVDQARDTRYAIRQYVESDRRWANSSRGKVRFAHAVVTPFVGLGLDFDLPDCPRWMIHDREDLHDLARRLADVPLGFETHRRVPTEDDCALIVDILSARGTDAVPSVTDEADERLHRADRLSEEQSQILRVTRLLRRVEIRGGAGSGKTLLALTQARQLAAGRDGRTAERVALLCYSIGLATHFAREVATWPHRQRPAFVGTFEDLANLWGLPSGSRDDPDYWEETLPLLMAERAAQLPPGERYDSFVVDEAQDFAESWWRPLIAALTDESDGGLFIYSDENQRLFNRFGRPPVPLVPLVLDHNLRNTKQIAEVFKPLAPLRMRLEGGDGPAVTFIPASPEEAVGRADDQVDLLLDEGWDPGHIALLTTGHRHPVQVERQESLGQAGYWRTFWEDEDVFFGHVLGAKGMERRVVVLCINEDGTRERFRERLYVGLSRATDRLVVVGDPTTIAYAGEKVATTLLDAADTVTAAPQQTGE